MLTPMRGAITVAVLMVACGAAEDAVVVADGGTQDASRPADVADARVISDGTVDVTTDRMSAPDAPPAAAQDVGSDAALDVAMDAPRDVASEATVDAAVDGASVPLPGAVPAGAACYALLTRLGVTYTRAGPSMGVVDPVTVSMPINGVNFRSTSFTSAARPLFMDCRLAVALWHLTNALRTRWNVTDVAHLGIYNYRVIAGTTTLSQHSYATAIDLSNFRTANGTTHSLVTDFTMNGRPTCPPRATGPRDQLLKEIACWMYESRVFHIVLTPNYNAAHRDHFHCDLSPGSRSIALELPGGVDPEPHPFFDLFMDDH
jgi:hypothetical protein